ncbi:hypothetical protein [Methylobacter sp. sgz302048]|uniref:hypothetical protein n=1 Tax=Methylobacter sp. sgz302048 TaxID=3455945 RepID=UPI003F9F3B01
MQEVDDRNPERWSYYDELLKSRFNHARELYPQFDKKITEMIQNEEIERAVDVRDGLPKIVKAGGNTLKKFMNGTFSYDDALQEAHQRGAGNFYTKRFSDFKNFLADENVDFEIMNISDDEKKQLKYLIDRIEARIKQISKKVNAVKN